jgi:hypothetical protein
MTVTRRFIQVLTIFVLAAGVAYLFLTSVLPIPPVNLDQVKENQGWFKMAMMTIIGFYFLSSPKATVD